jgi:hypothetical protein
LFKKKFIIICPSFGVKICQNTYKYKADCFFIFIFAFLAFEQISDVIWQSGANHIFSRQRLQMRKTFTTLPILPVLGLFFLLLFVPGKGVSQIIPITDSVQCFTAGDGAIFLDNGGDDLYFNCGCFTTTTLCSPDGNPITVDFKLFDVFATFDYLRLYDGTEPTGTLLYGNAAGDPNGGDITLTDMVNSAGSSMFTANSGCITFDFYATTVVNYEGWEVEVISTAGHPGDDVPCGVNIDCPGPTNITFDDIVGDQATVSWNLPDSAGTFFVEYDTAGFTPGTGANLIPTSGDGLTLSPLEEDTEYDLYIQLFCDNGDTSILQGPYSFQTPWFNDVGIVGLINPNQDSCSFGDDETIAISLQNFGLNPQTFIPLQYAVNGEIINIPFPSDGLYTNWIGTDSTDITAFETTYDFSEPGSYLIQAWTELPEDVNLVNDTFSYILNTAYDSLPFQEDFEDAIFPPDWTQSEGFNIVYAPNSHNNLTYVISDNMYGGDQSFTVTSDRFGPLQGNDTLSFDYRYVNWFAGTIATTLSSADSLIVEISGDCGETFKRIHVVDETNHDPTTEMTNVIIDLGGYKDEVIVVQFHAVWGSGDYWLDLDNINLNGCPINFALNAEISDESVSGASDASIEVTPGAGVAPYTYIWNDTTTLTTNVLDNIGPGTYELVVVDANGCTDDATYTVSTLVNQNEPASVIEQALLMPNPAKDNALFWVKLDQPKEVGIELFDPIGRRIQQQSYSGISEIRHSLDLKGLSPGLYLVRLFVDGEMQVKKLIISN